MSIRTIVVCGAAALSSSLVFAQDNSSQTNTVKKLSERVVTATRLPQEKIPLSKYPGNITVLSRERIESSPAFTLPDLLQREVGLTPLDTVGFGQFANLSMRGFGEKSGTLVLVDGVRMNDAGESSLPFLWNSIPLENIERIEVIRGGSSTTYGEGALAGVINIITKKEGDKPFQGEARGAVGNYGFYSGHLEASGTVDSFGYLASGDRQEWSGYRDFSSFRSWTARAMPRVKTDFGEFSLGYYYHENESENPGTLTRAQYKDDPTQAGATTFLFTSLQHRLSLNYSHQPNEEWTLLGNIFGQVYDTTSESAFGTGDSEQPNLGTTLQASHTHELAGHENTYTLGAEALIQDYSLLFRSAFGSSETVVDYWTVGAFFQDVLSITDRLSANAGIRFDYREWDIVASAPAFGYDFDQPKKADVWSPKAGLTYQVAEQSEIWFSLSRAYRLPSGNDISAVNFSPFATLFYPNPNIRPVDGRTAELGFRSEKWKYLKGALTYFYTQVEDDIVFDTATFQNANFDSTRQGVELSLRSHPCKGTELFFNTAYVYSVFDGGAYDGNRLPLVPEWQLSGGLNLEIVKNFFWTLESIYINGQTPLNDLANTFDRNSYAIFNTRLSYRIKDLTLFGAVNNLTDRQYEQFPSVGFAGRAYNPAPGINFQVGASVRF